MIFLVVLSVLCSPAYAQDELVIHKIFDKTSYNVGDTVGVKLEIDNPFGKEVQMMMQDKTVFGSMGYDVVCESGIIGQQSGIVEGYKSFKVYEPGNYSVADIRYRYVNPDTGVEMLIEYDEMIEIEVRGEKDSSVSISSISTTMNCVFDEEEEEKQEQQESQEQQQSMQEKMKEQLEKIKEQMSGSEQQGEEEQKEMSEQEQQYQNKKSTVQQQSDQDMSAAKKRLDKEVQEDIDQKKEELDNLNRALNESEDFGKLEEEMKSEGYDEQDTQMERDAETNETEFRKEYQNEDGEKGNITGKVDESGKVEDLKKITEEDVKKADELLEKNEDYKQKKSELENAGFQKKSETNEPTDDGGVKKSEEYVNNETNETRSLESEISPPKKSLKEKVEDLADKLKGDDEFKKSLDLAENLAQKAEDGEEIKQEEFDELSESLDSDEMSEQMKEEVEKIKKDIGSLADNSTDKKEVSEKLKEISQKIDQLGDMAKNQTTEEMRSVRIDDNSEIDVKIDEREGFVEKNRFLLLIFMLMILVYLYLRRDRSGGNVGSDGLAGYTKPKKKPDYRKVALSKIKNAEKMYISGQRREAYTKISEAVRYYIRYIFAPNEEELTSTDALRVLRVKVDDERYVTDAKKCFQMCDLVKFAKYNTNDKDFYKILDLARRLVK